MLNPAPIRDEVWDKVPPEARVVIQQFIALLEAQVRDLQARNEDLESRLKLNFTNSSKPPSSDPLGFKRGPPALAGKRKRGGQPGHRKAVRPLVPPEQVDQTIDCVPDACRKCGEELDGVDPDPRIHQVAELPKIKPIVTEYRIHQLKCTRRRTTTAGLLPDGVSGGSFGVSLQAVLATLAGAYRLSKRQIQQIARDLFGLTVSIGMIATSSNGKRPRFWKRPTPNSPPRFNTPASSTWTRRPGARIATRLGHRKTTTVHQRPS